MLTIRRRVWVPNQFPSTRVPGKTDACPAIVVSPNMLIVRHRRMPAELAALPGVDLRDVPTGWGSRDATTYTAEPIGKRPLNERDQTRSRFEFDTWAPAIGFLRFRVEGKKAKPGRKKLETAPGWSLSLRSQLDLPWAIVGAGEGDLATLLEAVRELVRSENHAFPPIVVEPSTPNICPAEDLPHVPQTQALAAVEGLISKTTRP